MEINRIAAIYDMSGNSLHNRECSSTGSEEADDSEEESQEKSITDDVEGAIAASAEIMAAIL